jgi:glycine/D-amino acid oxidase-like deaminating enzyme
VNEYPYWWDTVPARPESHDLDRHESRIDHESPIHHESQIPNPESRFDVAIVGAGYTGLAAARQLALAGASTIVLERDRVGFGASSRNGGQVIAGMRLDPGVLVRRFGEARAHQLFDIALESIDALEALIAGERIGCEYERTGHLQAAWRPSHFEAFRKEQALLARVFQHRVELVSRTDQRAELGSDAYYGVMVDERSGALNPAKYVEGLATSACRAGAQIATGTEVVRISRNSGRWRLDTSAGSVDAGDVLVATNGYTSASVPALQRRFIPVGSYIVATKPLAGADAAAILPRRRMAFDSKQFLFYFRLTRDNRLLFGGRAEFAVPTADSAKRAASILRRGLSRVFPQLSSAPIEYAWGGRVAFTRDEMPRAGILEGAYYAGGYCGHGIAMATYLGTLIGRRIAGEAFDHPLFDDRFAAIPLYRGRPWFLPFVGAYYKVKDWLR